ncbi:hypothetical protein ACWG8W_06395 [Citricoccus zhacaiensis]
MKSKLINRLVLAGAVIVASATVTGFAYEANAVESRIGTAAAQHFVQGEHLPEGGLPQNEITHHDIWFAEEGVCHQELWILPAEYQTVNEWMGDTGSKGAQNEFPSTHPLEVCADKPESRFDAYNKTSNARMLAGLTVHGEVPLA